MTIHVDITLPDQYKKHPLVVSWNKYWSGRHWTQRKRHADMVHEQMVVAMHQKYGPRAEREPLDHPVFIGVYVTTRTKHSLMDVDNICVKPLVDALVLANVLVDDGPSYVAGLFVTQKHDVNLAYHRMVRIVVADSLDEIIQLTV